MTLSLNRNPRRDLGVLLRAPRCTPSKASIKEAFASVGLTDAFSSTVEHSPGDFEVRTKLKSIDLPTLLQVTDKLKADAKAVAWYRGHIVLSFSVG